MNERIRELAIQAGVNLSSFQFFGTPIKYEIAESELEKFAELIVQECLEIVEDEDDGSADTKPVRWAMIRIKKHFGVEESKGWVCHKCGTDRTKQECPKGYTAALTGECPMIGEAQ